MKTDIHPNYQEITTTCSCGNVLPVMSTLKDNLSLDVCSKCHPFYTGKQKMLDSGGRVKKFQDRFGAAKPSKAAKSKTEKAVAVNEDANETIEEVVSEIPKENNASEAVVDEAIQEIPKDVVEDAPETLEEDVSEESKKSSKKEKD